MTTGIGICWGERFWPGIVEAGRLPPLDEEEDDDDEEEEHSSSRNVAFSRMVVYTSALAIKVVVFTPNRFISVAARVHKAKG